MLLSKTSKKVKFKQPFSKPFSFILFNSKCSLTFVRYTCVFAYLKVVHFLVSACDYKTNYYILCPAYNLLCLQDYNLLMSESMLKGIN